jgi:hypothetical protein
MNVWFRAWTVVLVLLLWGTGCDSHTKDTFSCVTRLDLPYYPSLAREAQIAGSAEASFTVGTDGEPTKISVKASHALFLVVVESRVSKSKFRQGCAGANLTLRTRFVLRPPRQKFGLDEITLVAPDTVEVTTTLPELREPQPASKKP